MHLQMFKIMQSRMLNPVATLLSVKLAINDVSGVMTAHRSCSSARSRIETAPFFCQISVLLVCLSRACLGNQQDIGFHNRLS